MNIAGFYEESITNGIGFRSVLFVSGCPHKCEGCHNPETHDPEYGRDFRECKDEILKYLRENKGILKGLTLSGGEPFVFANELVPFVEEVKSLGLDIWAYTGFDIEDIVSDSSKLALLQLVDVLVDGRFEALKKDPSLAFRGSTNQRIIYVPKYLESFNVQKSLLGVESGDLI